METTFFCYYLLFSEFSFSLRTCPLAFIREAATSINNLVRTGLFDMIGIVLVLTGASLRLPFHAHVEALVYVGLLYMPQALTGMSVQWWKPYHALVSEITLSDFPPCSLIIVISSLAVATFHPDWV